MKTTVLSLDLLRHIPLFRHLNETELRQISEVIRERSFAPGQVVLRQGDSSRDLWVVVEGQCEVVRRVRPADNEPAEPAPGGNHSEPESLVLAVLEPFSHFGEMSFFQEAPHSADVRARSPLKLLQITHSDYADMIDEGISAAYKLSHNVVQELADRLRRMDQWVAELAATADTASDLPEWSRFRNKLFNGWNL